jgi:hypothetical protein
METTLCRMWLSVVKASYSKNPRMEPELPLVTILVGLPENLDKRKVAGRHSFHRPMRNLSQSHFDLK